MNHPRCRILSVAVLVVLTVGMMATSDTTVAAQVTFYVATDGDDAWSGTRKTPNKEKSDGPFATLTRARDAVRQLKKSNQLPGERVTVVVSAGNYSIDKPLAFASEDSGTHTAPIVYRAAKDEAVRIFGGKRVTNWKPVTDAAVLGELGEAARGHVRRADLKALGVTDFGSPSGGGSELFFNGKPMTLSRWPNEGFEPIVDVLGKTEVDVRGTKGCREGIFTYKGDRPKRWINERDAWVHGYWFWDWSEQRHKIKAIDVERRSIEVQTPYHSYGYRKGQWFYAFNLLSEIDQPGEWYVDRERGLLYFWPPRSVENREAIVSVLPTMVTMTEASYVTLQGFKFEGARGTAITMAGGVGNRVVGCTIRNVGGWAVIVSGGQRHSIVGCDIDQTGGGGISLNGGDRTTLARGEHLAENNHIHHYARVKRVYQPAITLRGVGNRAAHNLIHHAPHMGMGFSGNDHLIEFNEIHHVCQESNDAGAIYTGRNWTMRGTIIRHNYLHDINGFEGRGCVGVYLDDMFCGTEVSGNLFYRVTRAAFIGGGRDCTVKNNLFVDCRPALHIDGRALGWAHDHSNAWIKEGREKGTLQGIRYKQPPYSKRYPRLVNILNDDPAAPKGNRVLRNVSIGGTWDGVHAEARRYQTIESNLVDVDPRFAAPDRIGEGKHPRAVDFALRPDSPAWDIGFEKLPLQRIGLYGREDSTSDGAEALKGDGSKDDAK